MTTQNTTGDTIRKAFAEYIDNDPASSIGPIERSDDSVYAGYDYQYDEDGSETASFHVFYVNVDAADKWAEINSRYGITDLHPDNTMYPGWYYWDRDASDNWEPAENPIGPFLTAHATWRQASEA